MHSLNGLKVLELSGHLAAAHCGKLMAGFGADVLQLPVAGPSFDLSDDEQHWHHTGKRRIALSLEAPADLDLLRQLAAQADVILDGAGFNALASRGLSAAVLQAEHPRGVLCQITPFGQTGPWRAWPASDITLYALSGLMQSTGSGSREPLNARPRLVELTGGMNAFIACLAALLRRERDGLGDVIDLSLRESAMENYEVAIAEYLAVGKVARRNGDQHAMVPWRTYPCADGEATIIGGPIRHWLKAAPLFDAPGLLDEKLADMGGRIAHRADTEALMRPWLATQKKRDVFHRGQQQGLAWSYLATMPEALDDPQHAARNFFVSAVRAQNTPCLQPGAPFRPTRSAWREAPAPSTVSNAAALLREWLAAPRAAPKLAEGSSTAPFAGLRVLDFTHDWAGPHAARLFADYGAEVIKVEYPQRLDGMRGGYPAKINAHPRFWQLHRGKASLTLDLKNPEHRQVLDALVRDTDLVIENTRPGVMARKGYDHAALKALKPDIILLSMSAFGATGPYARYCGYGGTLEAISGLQSLTAYEAQSPAYRVREMDVMNGIMGICAALLALWHRQRSGEGQWIDLSECETTAWFVGEHFAAVSRSGVQPAALGNRDAQHAPQGCYAAAGEDRWLVLSVRSDAEWQALAALLGPAALDGRYTTAAGRQTHHAQLDALIAVWAASRTVEECLASLQPLGIAAGFVASAADLASDPQLAARDWFQSVDGLRLPGLPFQLGRGGGAVRAKGPDLGSANAACFAAVGLAEAQPDLRPEVLGTAYARQ